MRTNKLMLLTCSIFFSGILAFAQNVDPYADDVYYTKEDAKKEQIKAEKAKELRIQQYKKMQEREEARRAQQFNLQDQLNRSSEDAIDAYNRRTSPDVKDSILSSAQEAPIELSTYQSSRKRKTYGRYSDRLRRFHSDDAVIINADKVYLVTDDGLMHYEDYNSYYGNGNIYVNVYTYEDPWVYYYDSWYPWYTYPHRYYRNHRFYYGGYRWRFWYDPWYDPYWYGSYYGYYPGYYGWGGYHNGYWDGYYDGYWYGGGRRNYYRRNDVSLSRPRDGYRGSGYSGYDYDGNNTNRNGSARSGWMDYNPQTNRYAPNKDNSSSVNSNGSRGEYNNSGIDYNRRGSWSDRNNQREYGTVDSRNNTVHTRIRQDINTNERAIRERSVNNSGSRGSYQSRGSYNNSYNNNSYNNNRSNSRSYETRSSTRSSYDFPSRSSSSGNSSNSNGSSRGSYGGRR